MKLVIVIDGDSAEELFAVGPEDLKSFFLPDRLNVKEEDVVKIHFEECQRNGKIISPVAAWTDGEKYTVVTHPDNFERDTIDDD